jgi:hypothetical protein
VNKLSNLIFILLLISGSASAQGSVIGTSSRKIMVAGTPSGTAPTFGTATSCYTGGSSCTSGTNSSGGPSSLNVAAGDSVFASVVGTSGGTITASDSVDGSFQCEIAGTDSSVSTMMTLCHFLGSAGSSTMTITCGDSVSTYFLSCVFFSVHCAATCIIEQVPEYASNTSVLLFYGGQITTSFQKNELIVGSFGCTDETTPGFTVSGGYSLPTNGLNSNSHGFNQIVLLTTTAIGNYTAQTASAGGNLNLIGMTLAIR